MKMRLVSIILVFLFVANPVFAQEKPTIGNIAREVFTDPTTYAPTIVWFWSAQGDWDTSQPLFKRNHGEQNPTYMQSGFPFGTPMNYGDGNRLIRSMIPSTLGFTIGANTIERFGEHFLIRRYPNKKRTIKIAGWASRIAIASAQSYILSAAHFRQWEENNRLLHTLYP